MTEFKMMMILKIYFNEKNTIVSLADANYFPLLEELVDSIRRFKESEKVAICILDAGLTDEQKKFQIKLMKLKVQNGILKYQVIK